MVESTTNQSTPIKRHINILILYRAWNPESERDNQIVIANYWYFINTTHHVFKLTQIYYSRSRRYHNNDDDYYKSTPLHAWRLYIETSKAL